MTKISIIMPAYNTESHIEKSIQSVLIQTFKNFELLVVNDGSTDNTGSKVKMLCDKDNRIKYFEIPNSGVSGARNFGLSKITGDYILFIDSDDYIEENMLEVLINSAINTNSEIVSVNYEKILPKKTYSENSALRKGYFSKKNLKELIYPQIISTKTLDNSIPKSLTTKLFKKSLISENNILFPVNLPIGEDTIFTVKSFLYAESFYYLPDEKLYKYLFNKNSVTNKYLNDSWSVLKRYYKEMEKISTEFAQYSLEAQLPYFMIEIAKGAIANVGLNEIEKRNHLRKEIQHIINDRDLENIIKTIDTSQLSSSRKLLVKLIRNKWTLPILLFTKTYNILNKFSLNEL